MKIAQIQMHVSADKAENIRHACELVRSAGDIDLAVLPEMFCCPYDNACFRDYGEPFAGPAQRAMSQLARERGIYLIAGSLPELEGHRVYNTSFVYAPDGTCIARHRKIHLFDIDVEGGQRFMESEVLSPGREVTTFDTPLGDHGPLHLLRYAVSGAVPPDGPAGRQGDLRPGGLQHDHRPRPLENPLPAEGRGPAVLHRGHLPGPGQKRLLRGLGTLHCLRPLEPGDPPVPIKRGGGRYGAGSVHGGQRPASAAHSLRPPGGRVPADGAVMAGSVPLKRSSKEDKP